jgi:hypothetical protein
MSIPAPPPPPPPDMTNTPHVWSALPAPPKRPMVDLFGFLGFWMRAIGFLLLFIGTLIVVAGASEGGGCVTSAGSCGSGFAGQVLNAILVAKLLWVLGLGSLGAGAGIRLHWDLKLPVNPTTDETNWLLAARRQNWWLLVLSILLLAFLLVWGAAGYAIIAPVATGPTPTTLVALLGGLL